MRISRHAFAPLIVVVLCGAVRTSHADPRKEAAEHFALAESAEKRKDWQDAISEYEKAYSASPHPWALFNIAVNYERLDQGRRAATYFRRYLEESKDAQDRDEVEARIEKLRVRPSHVEITTNPSGAEVFVDGDSEGNAPLSLELAAGEHTVHIAHDGRRSAARRVVAEFGEAIELSLDLDTRPGVLQVRCDVDGAEVRLNGEYVGKTPFSGSIPAGEYQLLVSKPGYRTVQRSVAIPADGSEQVRADLVRVDGKPDTPPSSSKWLLGMSYGLHATGEGMRYLFQFGYRTASNRFELGALLGTLGYSGGIVGADARLYFATGRLRPYARVGVLSGRDSTTAEERLTVVEGGAGILFSPAAIGSRTNASTGRRTGVGLEYFIEADVGVSIQDPPEDRSRYVVPIVGGILIRYGK